MMATRDLDIAVELLKVAECPNCDGCGAILHENIVPVCCGEPLGTGECCGNAIPDLVQELEQCQWCAEREELISKYDTL